MNSAIHLYSVAQQQAQVSRDACRRHHLADVPARERRLSAYGARLLGLVRPQAAAPTLQPATER